MRICYVFFKLFDLIKAFVLIQSSHICDFFYFPSYVRNIILSDQLWFLSMARMKERKIGETNPICDSILSNVWNRSNIRDCSLPLCTYFWVTILNAYNGTPSVLHQRVKTSFLRMQHDIWLMSYPDTYCSSVQ